MRKRILVVVVLATVFCLAQSQTAHHTFRIADGSFLLDGKPFTIISGEMHFARIPCECWRDRLRMAKAMGVNTIATYVFWNYQEPQEGQFNFAGNADVAAFVRTAQEEGLWVLIRPSVYACAEWEFGGYPWWLLKKAGLTVRSRNEEFLRLTRRYFHELGAQLAPLQITHGGNIIMVQLENEYGSYDKDKEYLALNKQIMRDSGFDVEFYTCDGPTQLPSGYLAGVLPAVNGLDDVKQVQTLVNTYHDGKGPYFIAEWYPAWFDVWGQPHHVVPASEYVATLDSVLSHGLSINMYMLHGGTTRGFMNGANVNDRDPYEPQISSYDYDAPIDEAGNATPKYMAFRDVIKKHLPPGTTLPEVPAKKRSLTYGTMNLRETAGLFANLPEPVVSDQPLTFEELNQPYGYVVYRTHVTGPMQGILKCEKLRDFAIVYVNGTKLAVLDRRLKQDSMQVALPAGDVRIDILVENLGRINYGPYLNDNHKGILGGVTLNHQLLKGWNNYSLPMESCPAWQYGPREHPEGPVLRKAEFMLLDDTADTYLDMTNWGKGVAWVNGHNLGRYWSIGPQQTLYVPGAWLKHGRNEVAVFEMLEDGQSSLPTIAAPILNEMGNPAVQIQCVIDDGTHRPLVHFRNAGRDYPIRYTLDGSEPLASSPQFASDIPVTQPIHLAARAFRNGVGSNEIAHADVVPSLTTGRPIVLKTPYSSKYPASGAYGLTDAFQGSSNRKDGFWQGFEGDDLDATVDLGKVHELSRLSCGFLQDTRSWIFFPSSVEFFVSSDGRTFASAGRTEQSTVTADQPASVKRFEQGLHNVRARYVRVVAKNIGVLPAWHSGKDNKAWLFVDEFSAE